MIDSSKAVISAALGYNRAQISPFLSSLRRTRYDGNVIIFVDDNSDFGDLDSFELSIQLVRTSVPPTASTGHLVTLRYFLLQEFLKQNNAFERALFTDIRDVIFQADPFEFGGWDRYGFFYTLEEKVIGECGMNSRWLSARYGQGILRSLLGEIISCCGTVFCVKNQLSEYVNKMCDHLRGAPAIYGMDTSAHNYIVRRDPITGQRALLNGLGPIMTVHYMQHAMIRSGPDGTFLNYDGTIPNLVHQYDRLTPDLAEKFTVIPRNS